MLKTLRKILIFAAVPFVITCGGFKLDSEKNCLNQQANCFKWDTTSPTFVSATPAPNSQLATLPTVTLVFSEELKNGTDVSSYTLSGVGAAGLKVSTVKYLGNFTYELSLSGSIVASGPIKIDFPNLKDYKNAVDNVITGQTSIQYTGNISASVTASTNHNGLGTGGYPSITVTFQHDYSTSGKNTWQIRVTNGVESCVAGTQVDSSPPSGPNQFLAANTQAVSAAIPVASFTLGTNRLVVCVQNQDNASVLVVWSAIIIRDDTAPTVSTATPISDSYGPGVQPFTVTCSDNAELIAVTTNSQTGSAPALPAAPAFDPTTGAITSGFAYTGPISIPNPTNPTYTNYRWLCRDIAGHNFGSVQSRTYGVDINIPPVNVTLSGGYYSAVSSVAGSHANTTIAFTTDQVNPTQYKIIRGGTGCSDGAATNLVAPTALPATPLTTVTNNFPFGSFPVNGTAYDVRVCVRNALNTLWGPAYLQIWRDDTVPVFAGIGNLVNPNDGTINLFWLPATDTGGSGVEFYEICQSTTAGACATTFTVNYQTSGAATSYQVTGLSTSTTYYFMVRARDYAGNREANVVERKSRLSLSVTVAGYSSAVPDFRVTEGSSTIGFTGNGTTAFANAYSTGMQYNIQIVNQPGGQVCSFVQNQYGTILADTTLNVNCATGYMVGGNFQVPSPVPLNHMLYRGNVSNFWPSGLSTITGLTVMNGNVYYALGGGAGVRRATLPSAAVEAAVVSLPGVTQGIVGDGTNLYVTEWSAGTYSKIWKIDLSGPTANLIAGGNSIGSADGPGLSATFDAAYGLALSGNFLLITENSGYRLRRMNLATGIVSTLYTHFEQLADIVIVGNFVYMSAQHQVLRATFNPADGSIGTPAVFAGSTTGGYLDAAGTTARFNGVHDLTTDGSNLYLVEYAGNRVRRIQLSTGQVTTLAGGGAGVTGVGSAVGFSNPIGIVSDGRYLYVSDATRIRKLTDSGLVGYWALAPGVNPNDYNSDGGATNNGTVAGGPLGTTTDRFGTPNLASSLNGTTQYVTANAPITVGGACNVSLSAWFKMTAVTGANQIVAYNGNSGSSGFGFYIDPSGNLALLFGTNGSYPIYQVSPGVWTHAAATCRNTNQWSFYVNGHQIFQVTNTPTATAPITFYLGANASFAEKLNGSVSAVRVYNRTLNGSEINDLAQDASSAQVGQSYNSRATGLLAHYEFSNGATTSPSGAIGGTVAATGAPSIGLGKDGDTNGAFSYSGAGQYYSAASQIGLPAGNHPRTVCAWVKPSAYPIATSQSFVSYGNTGGLGGCTNFGMQDNAGTQTIMFGSCGASAAEYTYGSYALPLNTWSHVCGSLAAGSVVSIYVNGSLHTSTTGVTTNWVTDTSVNTLRIAAFANGGLNFPGAIDDVRIYNSALSAFQIRQLAVQIPAGLVAWYDFNGDKADVSGFGQDLGNNGVNMDVDRFGLANASARFTASAYFDGAMNGFPLGTAPRTVCAWTNPSILFNGTFSEVVMYGNATNAWGFGMDASGGLPNGRIFILDTAGDLIYNSPHGLNIWRHICATYNSGTEQLYVDGYPVASVVRPISTGSGQLFIGRGVFGPGDYFNGNIDDVRIYNRALSIPEIQALLQQPNKRIFTTGMAYRGDLNSNYYWDGAPNSGAPTGATGIAGADAKCNWRAGDSAIPATGTYKAMVVDGVNRRACNGINCSPGGITDNIDWVLRSNLTYVRSDSKTPIFTTNYSTIFPFGTATNSIITGLANAWTGLSTGWQVANSGLDLDCSDWTSIVGTGGYGRTDVPTNQAILQSSGLCTNTYLLYCVEQ